MKNNILSFVIIVSTISFSQCKKKGMSANPSQNLGQIKLANGEFNMVPYKINDVFVFKNSVGDSITYKVISRSSYFPRMYQGGGTDDTKNSYDVESNETVFTDVCGKNYILRIEAPLSSNFLPQDSGRIEMGIEFGFPDCKLPKILPFSETFLVDTNKFYNIIHGPSILFYDSLNLVNKVFYSVVELKNTYPPTDTATYDFVTSMFYNKSKGIVGLRTKKGNTWCLK